MATAIPSNWRICPTCGRECIVNARTLTPRDGRVALRVVMKCKVCHQCVTHYEGEA